MSKKNHHISEFLDQYIDKVDSPGYAVLIKGKWGAGKSWFIDHYFSSRLDRKIKSGDLSESLLDIEEGGKRNHLYVSLYGITSTSEIEDELYKQVHPWLGSKGMQIAGSVLKSSLKLTANIDIDRDGKPDGSASVGLPSKLWDATKKASKMVIVFDDLERCSMQIPDVLGYINKFVEHAGGKVIILANPEEIKDDDDHRYSRIKEKLIGKEFELIPDVELAVESFIHTLSADTAKRLIPQSHLVISIYQQSGHNNLRRIRQGLQEFDRWSSILDSSLLENVEFYSHFLSLYCVYSIEIGAGTISASDLPTLNRWLYLKDAANQKREIEATVVAIGLKYVGTDLNTSIFSEEIWRGLISDGFVDSDRLNFEAKNSAFFRSDERPLWAHLWHSHDLGVDEFYEILIKVEREFERGIYENIEVLKHVAGTLIELSCSGFYSRSPEWVVMMSKGKIDELARKGMIKLREDEPYKFSRPTGWGGLGFRGIEHSAFSEISSYVEKYRDAVELDQRKSDAHNLMDQMCSDLRQFTIDLSIGRSGGGKFSTSPILHLNDPLVFFSRWKTLSMHDRRYVGFMFKERYNYLNVFTDFDVELPWIQSLEAITIDEAGRQSTTFGRASFAEFGTDLRIAISKIESRIEEILAIANR